MSALEDMSSVLRNLRDDLQADPIAALQLDDWTLARLEEFCAQWHADPTQGKFDQDPLLGEPIHPFLLELGQVPPWSRQWAEELVAQHGPQRCLELLKTADYLDLSGLADTLGVVLRELANANPGGFCQACAL